MESPASTTTAPISSPPPTAPPPPPPLPAPQSNGAAPSPAVEDLPTSGDDADEGFETASDPDDAADPLKSAAAVDGGVGNPSLEEAAAAGGEGSVPSGSVEENRAAGVGGEGSVPAGSVEENRAADVGGEEDGVMGAAAVEEPVVKVSDAVDGAAGEEPVVEVPVSVAAVAADGVEEIGAVPGAAEEGSAARDEVEKTGAVDESPGAVEVADGAEKIVAVSEAVEEVSEEAVGGEKIGAVSDDAVEEVSGSAPTDAVGEVSHYSEVASSEAVEKNEAVSDSVEEGSEATGIVADSDVPSEGNTVDGEGKVEGNGVLGAVETEVAGEKDETAEAFASVEIPEGEVKLRTAEVGVTGSDESIEEVNSDHVNLVVSDKIVAGGEKDEMLADGELGQDTVADEVEKIDAVSDPVDKGFEAVGVVAEVDQNAVPMGSEVTSDSKEEPVTGDVVKNESSGPNKDSELAAESKLVDVEGVADQDVEGAASGESLVEGAKSHTSAEDSYPVDSGEAGNDGGAGFDRGVEVENSVTTEDTADKLDLVAVEATDKNTGLSGVTGTTDSEEAKESTENHDVVDEVALMKQEKADPESVELIPVGESSAITADESHSREAQPISVSERDVEPEVAEPISVSEREVEPEVGEPISVSERQVEPDDTVPDSATDLTDAAPDDDEKMGMSEVDEGDDGTISEGHARVAILESSETAKQLIKEMEEGSTSSSYRSGFRSSEEISHQLDGQIVTDSEEEVDTDEEGDGRELFDSAALTALLKAATGASADGSITITPQDASRIFSVNRPAGLGSSVPSLKPAPSRSARPSPFTPSDAAVVAVPENNISEEDQKLQEKVEQIRVKFLRLVQRLGHSPEDTVAAQVLYRLGLAEGIRHGRQISRLFSIENAKKKALQLEDEGKEDLDFSCNILVLGKTGVGKSATINSIFGEGKSTTSPFKPATTFVREISGIVDGVKINILDTPGLRTSVMDQAANRKILQAVKKHTKRCPPDIVLYVDRMDTQTRDLNDLPLLRSITSILGSSIWFNAIVALTHAASAPPDGPNGSPLSYEVFIAQRSHVVQQSIRQAAGDMRLMNPVALVENHPSCRRNREGERVLPNGLSWRPQLLLLCYSSKILSEANSLLKLQDPSPGKLFGFRIRSPPLPYLLSSLLQSKTHPKLSADLGGDNGDSDIDLDDVSDTEQEEDEEDYNQLPPFKPLRKSQIAKLTKEQKRAYFDEYDYRVKLLQKTQWKEELKRMKEMRKKGKSQQDDAAYGDMPEDFDQDGAPASVPVPLPDMVLPPSFDSDNPVYRYRLLEPTSEFRTRPASESQLDHDCGYDGVSIEESLAIAGKFPAGLAIQITKDKTDFNLHVDSSVSAKHGENGSTLAGFDIQQIGKQLAYVVRGETKFKNLKKNKTAAGISVTFLGETVATGMKIEDQLSIGKRVGLVATTGAIRAQGDMAYGANMEVRLRDKDYPIGQALTTLGLSLMRWRSDLALGANLQSQFSIGRSSKMAVRVGLNNKLTGQVTVRTSTSEQLQIALVGILPLIVAFYRKNFPGESYMA